MSVAFPTGFFGLVKVGVRWHLTYIAVSTPVDVAVDCHEVLSAVWHIQARAIRGSIFILVVQVLTFIQLKHFYLCSY